MWFIIKYFNIFWKKKDNYQSIGEEIFDNVEDEKFSMLYVRLELRRRTLFYSFNLVIPSFIITVLSLLGFLLPPECGEKIGLRIIIF